MLASLALGFQHGHALHSQPTKQFAESLSGLIERARFFNDDNGLGLLKVEPGGTATSGSCLAAIASP